MVSTAKGLFDLTAGELMTLDVLCLPQDMSMRKAASMIVQHRISGAPVVDEAGKCVGVVSRTDFLAPKHPVNSGAPKIQCVCTDWEVIPVDNLPMEAVKKFMTADPVMVQPGASIGELAQRMIDAHIHRIIVVDAQERPIGIVTSTDVLAALANAYSRHSPGWAPPQWR